MKRILHVIFIVALCTLCAALSDIYLHISGSRFVWIWVMCCSVFALDDLIWRK